MRLENSPSQVIDVPWYAAHTKPQQERVALENLVRQGYGVYLPLLKTLVSRRNLQDVRFVPLFPRYIFFQPSHSEISIAPVRSTKGVTNIVQFGGRLAVLQPRTLQNIRAFERHQNAAGLVELSGLQPGEKILITAGPLAGLEGLVSAVSSKRVTVLMRLLGEQAQVQLGHFQVRAAA